MTDSNLPNKCCVCLKKPTTKLTIKGVFYENVKILWLGVSKYSEVNREISVPLCDLCEYKIKLKNKVAWGIIIAFPILFLFLNHTPILYWLFHLKFYSFLGFFMRLSASEDIIWGLIVGAIIAAFFRRTYIPVRFNRQGQAIFKNKEYAN